MSFATNSDRSLGQVIKDLLADVSALFRSEVALLKLEFKDTIVKLGGGIGMFAGAAFLGFFGLAFFFVTLVLVLVRLGVPAWVSTLIVTLLLFICAAVLALMGKKKFAATNFVPTDSVDQIKGDIQAIRADIARVRSR